MDLRRQGRPVALFPVCDVVNWAAAGKLATCVVPLMPDIVRAGHQLSHTFRAVAAEGLLG
jgi:hypothetical protein